MVKTFTFNPNTITTTGQQQLTWNNQPQSITKFAGDINQVGLQDVAVTITSNCQRTFPNQKYTIKGADRAYINTNYES
jgi:hypothetical protein